MTMVSRYGSAIGTATKAILQAAALYVVAGLGATSARAGEIRDFFESRGGCQTSTGPMMLLYGHVTRNSDVTYLGKKPEDWTDDNIAEFRTVYSECLRRWPGMLGKSMRIGQPIVARPEDVKAMVDQRIAELMAQYIGPAREEAQQHKASEDARKRIEQAAILDAAKVEQLAAEREKSRADANLAREREEGRSKRAALERQAQADLEAAEAAKRLADEEAPLIASAEKKAADARNARLEAERRLDEKRQSLDRTQQVLATENAGLNIAERKRLAQERLKQEKREDEALAKTCEVSIEQFNKLALGMHLRQVRQTFGCLGVLTSSDSIGNSAVTTYRWDGASGFSYTIFENDALISKSQNALN